MAIGTKKNSKRRSKISGAATYKKSDTELVVVIDDLDEELSFQVGSDKVLFNPATTIDGRVFTDVSSDKSKLMSVRPLVGTFFVKVKEFAKPEGQLPAPRHYEIPVDGGKRLWIYDAYTVLLEVVTGAWTGTVIPVNVHYTFIDSGDGEYASLELGGKHNSTAVVFLECAGLDFDADSIPLSENVLPWLEKIIVERGRTFMAIVNDGYVSAFAFAP